LPSGSTESLGTCFVHVKEAKCLGIWHSVSSGLQEFDVRGHFPKHGVQVYFGQGSLRNRAPGYDDRTPGKGETLNDSEELAVIEGE